MSKSRKLTPTDKKLNRATNEIIVQQLRRTFWLCLDKDKNPHVLLSDAGRNILLAGESFSESPEFLELPEKLRENHEAKRTAFEAFVKRVLCEDADTIFDLIYPYLDQYVNQYLHGVFTSALSKNTLDRSYLFDGDHVPKVANLTTDGHGNFFFETVYYNLEMTNTDVVKFDDRGNLIKDTIPGTITSRFVLTKQGFKLESVDFSNGLLESLCLEKNVEITEKKLAAAHNEEYQMMALTLAESPDDELKSIAQTIFAQINHLGSTSPFNAILNLTRQLLLDPFDETIMLAFERIANSSFECSALSEEEIVALKVNMETFISTSRDLLQQYQQTCHQLRSKSHRYAKPNGLHVLDEIEKIRLDPLRHISISSLTTILRSTTQLMCLSNQSTRKEINQKISRYHRQIKTVSQEPAGFLFFGSKKNPLKDKMQTLVTTIENKAQI